MKDCSLKIPKNVYSGADAIKNLETIIEKEKAQKIALFTAKDMEKFSLTNPVIDIFNKTKVAYEVFDDFPAEPTYMEVTKIVEIFKTNKYDLIVALGGGSVIDTAKLASCLVNGEYSVKDLLKEPSLAKKDLPTVIISTTAGTGAECTPNSIVGVPEENVKVGIVNDNLIPDYVILDARMIQNLPRKIAASTGIDALCHAIECFTSKKANAFSDTFALEALDLIMNNIVEACDNADAIGPKINMQIAAFYAGVAITSSGTTAVHALSYPLGGRYHIAHGVANAMLLIPVMKVNEIACKELFAKAYDRVNHDETSLKTIDEKSKALIDWMDKIVKHLDIPTDLKQYGVDPKDIDELVESGMNVKRLLLNNMKDITKEDAYNIYREVLK